MLILIEDLGMRIVGSNNYKKRYGLYECPICHKHFECRVSDVKNNHTTKCLQCANSTMNKTMATKAASEFIEKAKATHGDLYEYSLDNYINSKTKIRITCKIHGVFEQSPNDHLRNHGCPHCAFERSNIAMRMSEKSDRPTILYYIYFPEVNLWKVGCTSRTISERFKAEILRYEILDTKEYTSGNEAYRVEKFILDATKEFQFIGKVLGAGNTELRTQPIDFTKYKEIL